MNIENDQSPESDPANTVQPDVHSMASLGGQAEVLASISSYLQIVAGKLLEQDPVLAGRIQASDLVQETFVEILSDPRFGDLSRSQQFDGFDIEKLTTRMWLKLNEIGRMVRAGKRNPLREQPLPSQSSSSNNLDPRLNNSSQSPDDSIEPKLPSSSGPDRKVILAEDIATTLAAIGKLEPDYQQVIQMRDLQQLSFTEIGQHMQRSEEAVKKLWQRALVKLQKHLGAR